VAIPFLQTGATYPPSLIASFAQLARAHNIAFILDETYRDFINTSAPPHNLFASKTWRSSLIHLFSFSKSYCIPGHRVGGIVASPTLLNQVRTVLDCLQVCPPRAIQLALSSTLESLRPFVQSQEKAVEMRHRLFREHLPEEWVIGSFGGYYAFVRHPYENVDAEKLSQRLALEAGVVTLPASFFSPAPAEGLAAGWDANRWVRFSVANVTDEQIVEVCQRLAEWKP
jgi:aspartate/methionine/tyrosine aminotransferase